MTYKEAKEILDSYKSLGSVYGLDGITRLMEALGRPERKFKAIHVAGTNGKGSTVTALATILSEAGWRTVSYTSPEVSTYLDRFRVNAVPTSEDEFVAAFAKVESACQDIVAQGFPHPTIFEMELAISYLIGLAQGCTVMVQETGLGGRLDATNVVEKPELVVFTAIGMDHMQFLGDTIEKIAMEKAGIIKEGVPVVSYDNGLAVNEIIKEAALLHHAPCHFASFEMCEVVARNLDGQTILYDGEHFHYPLIGTHQVHNFALIMKACEVLTELGYELPHEIIRQGLKKLRWPGRFEVVKKHPVIVLDGAHNPQAAQALSETVRTWFPNKKVHILMHLFKDKDALGILEAIAPVTQTLTLTTIDNDRSSNPQALENVAALFLPPEQVLIQENFTEAIIACTKRLADDDVLIICGSLSHLEESRRVLAQLERIDDHD